MLQILFAVKKHKKSFLFEARHVTQLPHNVKRDRFHERKQSIAIIGTPNHDANIEKCLYALFDGYQIVGKE